MTEQPADNRSEVIREMFADKPDAADYRSLGAIHQCPCGSDMFNLIVRFDMGEVCFYLREMRCASCGSLALAPIPDEVENDGGYNVTI